MNMSLKNQSLILHKILCFLMACVFCLSAMMTGTYGWAGLVNALNEFRGSSEIRHEVVLQKYERDLDGGETTVPVFGAGFALFKLDDDGANWTWLANPDTSDTGGYYYTDAEGLISITDLTPGKYKFVEYVDPYGYEITAGNAEYEFEVVTTNKDPVVVTAYNQVAPTRVELMKTVSNADGAELSDEQKAKVFTFEVSFSDGKLYQYFLDTAPEDLKDLTVSSSETSVGTLTLRHGETATFVDVPTGVVCTAYESAETGYRHTSQSHQVTARLPDEAGHYAGMEFLNLYEEDSLVIDKQVTGEDPDENAVFTFVITFADKGTYAYEKYGSDGKTIDSGKLKSGGGFTLQHGQSIVFLNLPVGLEYTVEELVNGEYIAVSPQQYEGEIHYKDQEYPDADRNVLHFVNSIVAADSGSLIIEKKIPDYDEYASQVKDHQFEFTISFSDGGTYSYIIYNSDDGVSGEGELKSGGTMKLKHGQRLAFPNIPSGVKYTINEAGKDNYLPAYTDKEGYIRTGYTSYELFRNKYLDDREPDPEEAGGFELTKEVNGSDQTDPARQFTFTIAFYDADGNEVTDQAFPYYCGGNRDPENPDGLITSGDAVTISQGETIRVAGLPEGYSYKITEADHAGYIKTKETTRGTIIGGEYPEIVYNNLDEEVPDTGAELKIRKSVYGTGADREDEFRFKVEFADGGAYSYVINGDSTSAQSFPDDGIITLRHGDDITFLDIPEGTGYKVTELNNSLGYQADVQVMSGAVYRQSEELHFRNYRAQKVTLLVRKVVVDGPAVKDKFTFTVIINGEEVTFTLEDGESREFTVYPGDYYEVREEDPYRYGYLQQSITNGSGIVGNDVTEIEVVKTNKYTSAIIERTGISVEKKWVHGSDTAPPEKVYVQLYRDGEAYGPALKLSEDNGWWHTWVGLNKAYTWTVDEEKIPTGYEKRITGDARSEFVITNVHESDDGTGTPTRPGGDPGDEDPGNADLPGGGTNTGTGSGRQSGEGSRDSAGGVQTGDPVQFWFWCILMIASAMALRHILFGEDKRSRQQ